MTHAENLESLHRYLKERLIYDPHTGVFTWRDGRHAGKRAGGINDRGYRRIKLRGKRYKAARLAYFYMTGAWPPALMDHRNRTRDDDRWDNLRPVDYRLSGLNRSKKPPTTCPQCQRPMQYRSKICRRCWDVLHPPSKYLEFVTR